MEKTEELLKEGVFLWNIDEIQKKEVNTDALIKLEKLQYNKPGNIMIECNIYRKYVPVLIEAVKQMNRLLKSAIKENDRFYNAEYDKKNKRWSDVEDNALIDYVAAGNKNMAEISTIFGRSPGAIQSHLSELIGRKRLSKKVVGKFIGKADGVDSMFDLNGTVYTE